MNNSRFTILIFFLAALLLEGLFSGFSRLAPWWRPDIGLLLGLTLYYKSLPQRYIFLLVVFSGIVRDALGATVFGYHTAIYTVSFLLACSLVRYFGNIKSLFWFFGSIIFAAVMTAILENLTAVYITSESNYFVGVWFIIYRLLAGLVSACILLFVLRDINLNIKRKGVSPRLE